MTWTEKLAVGEFELLLVFAGKDDSGVILPPSADLSDPDFVEALETAQVCHEYLRAFGELTQELYDLKTYGKQPDVYMVQRNLSFLEDQAVLDLDDGKLRECEQMLNAGYVASIVYEHTRRESTKRKVDRSGYVYLLREVNGAHFKIGKTNNPESRMNTFAVKLPFKVEFECVIKTDNMTALELSLHTRFADKRIDGEWFALNPADVEYIKGLANG